MINYLLAVFTLLVASFVSMYQIPEMFHTNFSDESEVIGFVSACIPILQIYLVIKMLIQQRLVTEWGFYLLSVVGIIFLVVAANDFGVPLWVIALMISLQPLPIICAYFWVSAEIKKPTG